MVPFNRPCIVLIPSLFAPMALSCIISEIKRDMLVENRIFSYPIYIRRPRIGGPRRNIAVYV